MKNGCPWDESTCEYAAVKEIWIVYAMHMRMVALGMKIRVDSQLNMDI